MQAERRWSGDRGKNRRKKGTKNVGDDSIGGKYCRNESLPRSVKRAQYHGNPSQKAPHSYTLRRRLPATLLFFFFLLSPSSSRRLRASLVT